MSQRLHNTEGWEDDKGQEQSHPAPLQQIPTRYCSLLEHRLVIACSEFKRQDTRD
ncbi:hypothetical protein B0H65DRAFT_477773 [Neurospora tetraspora]|uniref:Uncharacterized protein n=1 Tax=Neurospora tetraspora TaxID=94610 RepID=A0AAE0J738_9PEZI|nr:hypothetical protein B0H65DRAFT_477773 [Neurospora tetraspora]